MLTIFLKDSQNTIEFNDYPGQDPIKFMMNFKKIFPSTFDLLLPVLPENQEDLAEVTWESTGADFEIFKRLIQEWANVEIRLNALTQYKDQQTSHQIVKQAQLVRKKFQHKQPRLQLLQGDYIFLQAAHTLLDAELVEIGGKFYLPTLQENWKDLMPKAVLQHQMTTTL